MSKRTLMRRRLVAGMLVALVLAACVTTLVLNDGIIDALCATLEPGSPTYVLLGCTNPNSPYGS